MDLTQTIVLENRRTRLEPLGLSHLDFLLPIPLKYPNLLRYSPSAFGTREQLETYIQTALKDRANGRYAFAIFDKEEDRFVGSTSYGNISPANHRLEIGWTWLDKDVQGSGINKYCKHLLLEYAFEVLGWERVELKTDSRNLQSRRAMEKIGAKYEGELRNHVLMRDGYRRNTVYYSILREEWMVIRETIFGDITEK